jgi:hypothetical protein
LTESGADIACFLTRVLRTRDVLQGVYAHYVRRGNRVHWGTNGTGPIWAADSYIEYGLMVTGSDGRNYELSARLRWSGERWIVEAEAAMEEEDAAGHPSYPTLRELPGRASESWQKALEDFARAVSELTSFDDLIPTQSTYGRTQE